MVAAALVFCFDAFSRCERGYLSRIKPGAGFRSKALWLSRWVAQKQRIVTVKSGQIAREKQD
jgi:hypothetical protein